MKKFKNMKLYNPLLDMLDVYVKTASAMWVEQWEPSPMTSLEHPIKGMNIKINMIISIISMNMNK